MAEEALFKHRYIRNFNTFSPEEQDKLSRSRVVIIGLGGLGGSVCEMLARVGVGHMILIDGDVFEQSNLNRQLLCQEHLIGTSKAQAAKDRIQAVNSQVSVSAVNAYLDAANMDGHIKNTDVVVDCLDSIDTRFALQDAATKAKVPIVAGAIAGLTGLATTIFPGDAGYALVYGDKCRSTRGVEVQTGNIAYCAGMVAMLQSSETVKVLLGRGDLLQNRLLVLDLWENRFEVVDLT
jgi:molybdopterin/thiamine biosynthesis adenylyltransferase